MTGERIDLTSEPAAAPGESSPPPAGRRFVGVHFTCCEVYARVYLNRPETAYEGRCPRCMRRVELKIGPGGTDARFFTAR